jgi:phenylacetate-CoA ligase
VSRGALGFWLAADSTPTFRVLQLDQEQVGAIAGRRLSRLLFHLARTNAFYGRRLQDAGIEWADPILEREPHRALHAMPPISKFDLRRAGDQVLEGGAPSSDWYRSSSSGSTGEPFQVYYEPRAWARLKYLVKLRARYACGLRAGDRVALLDTVAPEKETHRLGWGTRWARISVLQPAEAIAAALKRFAPDVVYGLPSSLLEVGRVLESQRQFLPVRAIFASGELLHRAARESLTAFFQARVFDVYGTSETKEIAWECTEGRMHLNRDVVHLETVDEAGRALPSGVEGDLVATTLVNRAMPLLRYRTGDRGTLLSERCSCGCALPLLGVVTGRTADVLVLEGGQRISPYALTCAIERVPGLVRYQVSQLDLARVLVRAILEARADRAAVTSQVRMALRGDVAPFLDADVEFVDQLPTGPRAKFRVVEPLP